MMIFKRALSTQSRTYRDAIAALNSCQSNHATIEALRVAAATTNTSLANLKALDEMREWCRRIGYERLEDFDRLNVVHVTGTKGKGSTCAFVSSILSQYQFNKATNPRGVIQKLGLYTSPHLKTVRERIRLDGQPISEAKFTQYFFQVWDRLEASQSDLTRFSNMGPGVKPVYFRMLTLLSFHVFMSEGVDSAIYEVGVGGEYDSTNIFVKPTATGVTSLGLDHTALLGNTLESIAWNKSGIFKSGVPALAVKPASPSVEKVLSDRALEKGTRLTLVEVNPAVADLKLGLAGGEFQVQNASLAVELVRAHVAQLSPAGLGWAKGTPLPARVSKGLERAEWPGRCQTKTTDEGQIVWRLDGAHTAESIRVAGEWYETTRGDVGDAKDERIRVLLFNQQTRDAGRLLSDLVSVTPQSGFDEALFCANVTWATGTYSADLASMNTSSDDVDALVVQRGLQEAWMKLSPLALSAVLPTIEDAVNRVRELQRESGKTVEVLVTGSLHLVGGVLVVLEDQAE
ncbi:FolC bifunctional protein [Nadsonia fulvescens var. elongata DSM 6958]|uniref:Folylpolyglutamate synthase n=1 Tax=Nadsonia fulvescens var. elongata DSM 6958 TaxID=857566 RepID=A0A1E3PL71_9ASCO|nr:FolC bifunctional protein [Nadsonia fulvescens var. elongata DSM 6958]